MITIICVTCGEEFKTYPYEKGKRKYCSQRCYYTSMKGLTKINKGSFKKGNIVWNTGLTKETDGRVRRQAEKISGKREEQKVFQCVECSKEIICNCRSRKYCNECKKEKMREWQRKNYKKNKHNWKLTLQQKKLKKEYMKEWKKKNKRSENIKQNNYHKKRKKEDKQYNIRVRLRNSVWFSLSNYTKTGKIMKSVKYGINYEEIIEHLKPFPKDLSKYHIDHIKPLCSFEFVNEDGSTNLEKVREAFAPKNHQWLTISRNCSKGGRVEKQTSLR